MKRSSILAASVFILGSTTFSVVQSAWAGASPAEPSAEQQLVLDRYAAFTQPIHIIAPNETNQIHAFLTANAGKTIFLDTEILRYTLFPSDLTDEEKANGPPTDRYDCECGIAA